MHRQEHILFRKEWTKNMLKFVIRNANKNLVCILIAHHLTESLLKNFNLKKQTKRRVIILPRLPYLEFMKLMNNTEFIATDGCTNQEEAYYLGKPLLALRNRTERIEGLEENVVISKGNENIIKNFLKNYDSYRRKPIHFRERPSKIIVDYLSQN